MVGLLALVTACDAQPPTSFADAKATAAGNVHEAIAGALPSGTYLEEMPPQELNCTDSFGKSTGEVMASVIFWAHVIDASKNNEYFDKLRKWWSDHGWSLETDSRPKDMFMNATRNGYLMSVQTGAGDRMTIGNTAPCTKGKGT